MCLFLSYVQDTYVIFGTAATDTNGREAHLPASKASREVYMSSSNIITLYDPKDLTWLRKRLIPFVLAMTGWL